MPQNIPENALKIVPIIVPKIVPEIVLPTLKILEEIENVTAIE